MQIMIKHHGQIHIPKSDSSTWDVCTTCSLKKLCKRNYTHNSVNGYVVYNVCALTNTNGFKVKRQKMSKTFDDYCMRKDCKKPVALNVKPITTHDGSSKFAYEIEWHRTLLEDCFESGGYCGTEPTEEEALWHCRTFMFHNMIGINMAELFGLATKLI